MKDQGNHFVAAALATAAVLAVTSAQAQYAPYGPAAQVATAGQGYPQQQAPGYGYGAYSQSAQGQPPQGYTPPRQNYMPPQQGYAQTPRVPGQPTGYGAPQGYPQVAQAPAEQLPPPTGAVDGPSVMQNGGAAGYDGNYSGASQYSGGYPATTDYAQPTPTVAHESYPATTGYAAPSGYNGGYSGGGYSGGGYSGGECATCNTGGYSGGYDGYSNCGYENAGYGCQDYGVGQYMGGGSSRQCFVGVYGLFLERDDSAKVNTAIEIDTTGLAYPYYPPNMPAPAVIRLDNTDDVDYGFQGGAEIRFGSTFGETACNSGCGGGYGSGCGGCGTCCTHQPYAWEVAYWAIAEDDNSSLRTDTIAGPDRMYSMIDYRGLEYDRDSAAGLDYAYAPMNNYWGGPPPIQDPALNAIVPVAFWTRTNFSTQNLEVNFLRLPLIGGCGTCGIDCGGCGCDPCGGECGCGPKYSLTGLCGVRYMRMDDDFFNAVQFSDPGAVGGADGGYDGFYAGDAETELFHEINVDKLVGFQMGANVDYMCTSCWSLFAYSNFGVYNNHMSQYQRVFENGAGEIRFVNDGGDASVRSTKDDIAFLGELRAGMGYQVSCNCRITAAWRAVAISGAALSVNQIRPFDNQEIVSRIDSQGALIMHGLQVGSEFNF
jgi:hypothetical protein